MRLKTSGEIGIEKQRHFALFDMDETLSGDEGVRRRLMSLGGIALGSSTDSFADYSKSYKVPSVWMNEGAERIGGAAFGSDFGMAYSAGAFDGNGTVISANGFFRSNQYATINLSGEPSLLVHFNESGVDTTMSYRPTVTAYSTVGGNLVSLTTTFGGLYALFMNNGVMYLAHTVSGYNAPFGWLPENSASFGLIDYLEPMRLYQIQSVPNVAHGTVYDAAGRPMAGCRVLAYERTSGRLVGSAVSASDGKYECPILVARGEKIFLVCLDNDAAPDFDARIIDRVSV